jgi:hypothetical protein
MDVFDQEGVIVKNLRTNEDVKFELGDSGDAKVGYHA